MEKPANRGIRNTVIACVFFVLLVLLAVVYNTTRTPILSDEALRELGTFVLPRPREIADISLTDHKNMQFGVQQLQGVWSFVYFGFTSCPDICPVTLSVLAQVERHLQESAQKTLFEKFQVILVTVDPERDDVATLQQYVENFSHRFIGVTGKNIEIGKLARQLNVAYGKVPDLDSPVGYQVEHSGNIVVLNPQGHYHGFIKMPHSVEQVVETYRTLSSNF